MPSPVTTAEVLGGLHTEAMGQGSTVVFVHSSGTAGARAWREQWPLAQRWRLVFPYRLGYAPSPAAEREDFAADAEHLAEVLGDGAHLVGHSYGAVAALLATALRPQAVWTLTVIEPSCSAVARGDPAVDAYEAALAALNANPPDDPAAYLRAVVRLIEPAARLPRRLPRSLAAYADRLRRMRWPAEADLPLDALLASPCPKLVISGGQNPVYETIADTLTLQIGGQRKILPGAGHRPQDLGEPFNEAVESFWKGQTLYRA